MENHQRKIWIAALLSILQPGLGHFYVGKAKKGILLYFFILVLLIPVSSLVWIHFQKPINIFIYIGLAVSIYAFPLVDVISIIKRYGNEYSLKKYNKWYIYLVILILGSSFVKPLFAFPVKKYIARSYKVPAGSMIPTLQIGDHIISNILTYNFKEPEVGDLIVFKSPESDKDFIKRIVAKEGDLVELKEKKLYVNNKLIQENYTIHSAANILNRRDNYGPIEVPPKSFFVLGDNRDNSFDSRIFGFVTRDLIKGRVDIIYFSMNTDPFKIRWDRVGINPN